MGRIEDEVCMGTGEVGACERAFRPYALQSAETLGYKVRVGV